MNHRRSNSPKPVLSVCTWILAIGLPGTVWAQSLQPALFVTDHIRTSTEFQSFASIKSFTIDPMSGALTPVGTYFTNDYPYELALSPNGRYLAVGHASALANEDLIVFRVNADASLTMFAVVTVQGSPFEIAWIDNSTLAVLETRENNCGVWTYDFDSGAPLPQKLAPIDDARTGAFSSHLALHPSRPFLYVPDSPLFGTSSLFTIQIEPDFTLTELQQINVASYALDIAITPNGRFLYMASGAGSDTIQGFTIGTQTGTLTPMGFSPFATPDGPPSHVAVTPDGAFLFVFHGATESIRSFAISEDDGLLTDTFSTFNIGGNGIFEAIEIYEDLLFVTRNSGSGITAGILVFRIFEDGSFMQIGDSVPAGTRPYFMTTWKPLPIVRGDVNGDGVVNLLDIPAYVAVLLDAPLDPDHVLRADVNQDGTPNGADTQEFVEALLFVPTTGACCFAELPCVVVTQDDCEGVLGGTYSGDNTECAVCPAIPAPVIDSTFASGPPFFNCPGTTHNFAAFGSNFSATAAVTLVQSGQPDLLPIAADVLDPFTIVADFDFSGVPTGPYTLRVTNPDGQFADSPETFLAEACPP